MITDYFTVQIKAPSCPGKKRKIEIIISEEEEKKSQEVDNKEEEEERESIDYEILDGEKCYVQSEEEEEEGNRKRKEEQKDGEEQKVAMELSPKRTKLIWLDAIDKQWAGQYKWHECGRGYAARSVRGRNILLHREIIKKKLEIDEIPKGLMVDHIDGNMLNNTRSNLRLCTPQQNAQNRKRHRNNTSSVKGVYFHKQNRRWCADICYMGKIRHLGYYHTLEEAARARRKAEKELFGEFMRKQ